MNNVHGDQGESPYCYFHPKELVVGVCALCLKERLLILASKQGELHLNNEGRRSYRALRIKTSIALPKVFALGSFLQRLDSRHNRRDDDNSDDDVSIASLEDSFISIKFEDNGDALWDNKKAKAMSVDPPAPTSEKEKATMRNTVVEHVKRGGVLRWRKQVVGRLLQLARWRRSNKAVVCHVGFDGKAAERGKGRRGWIRSLTRRVRAGSAPQSEREW